MNLSLGARIPPTRDPQRVEWAAHERTLRRRFRLAPLRAESPRSEQSAGSCLASRPNTNGWLPSIPRCPAREMLSLLFGVVLAIGLLNPTVTKAQHVHVNGGALSATEGSPLAFINGPTFDTNAAYDVYLSLATNGSFANLYQGAGVTFTALASTFDLGGPAFGHAADGAFLELQFVSVDGPPGGVFGVWMQEPGNPARSSSLFTLPIGTRQGTNRIALSESDGTVGADPYGHIHGRTFTASQPGLYTIGCRLVDTSSNGTGGRPIHPPSAVSYFHFQAGLTLAAWSTNRQSVGVTFGTTTGKRYFIETTTDLAAPVWTVFAGPFTGNNRLQSAVAATGIGPQFFRVRSE